MRTTWWRRIALALGLLLAVLGALGIAGHYASAPWDTTIQQSVRAISGALDLQNPSLVLSIPLICAGLTLVIVSRPAVRDARGTVGVPPAISNNARAGRERAAVMTWVYHDFENQAIGIDHVHRFAEFVEHQLAVSPFEGFVYFAHAQNLETATTLLSLTAFPDGSAFHIVNIAQSAEELQLVDKRIITDILRRMLASTDRMHVIIISADEDYLPVVRLLTFYGHESSVWVRQFPPESHSREKFIAAGAKTVEFARFLKTPPPPRKPRKGKASDGT